MNRGPAPFAGKWGLTPFLIVLFLTGCGFHLQGRQPLPQAFELTYIDAHDEQTDFVQDLRKALIASGSKVISTKGSSGATISLHEDELSEKILSVSARNIPTEYELTYRVKFSVVSEGKTLIDQEEVTATRDFSFDETQLLAKEREQEILREGLARDLVALVMRRLAAL